MHPRRSDRRQNTRHRGNRDRTDHHPDKRERVDDRRDFAEVVHRRIKDFPVLSVVQ